MAEPNPLCDLWELTIVKVFKHDSSSQLGLMLKEWIKFIKLENFNSLLNFTIDDFTPSGNLSYMNKHGEILHYTPLREFFNLRCYIQHLMDESEDETENLLSKQNWMKQNNWKFMKYVIHHRDSMTPEQLKQKPFKEIFKKQHEKLDIEEGESNGEEEKSTTSSENSEFLNLTKLLKMKKSQIQHKHFKFIMIRMKQHMIKTIHQKLKMIHLIKILKMKFNPIMRMGSKITSKNINS